MENKYNTFTIFSKIITTKLINSGFMINGIGVNKMDKTKPVFFFDNTQEFQNKLKEIQNNHNK